MFLRVAILALSIFTVTENQKSSNEILFVASQDELSVALEQRDLVDGVAISMTFYGSASSQTQEEIAWLAGHILSHKYHPVYLYGVPFDINLATKLLVTNGKIEDGAKCKPTVIWAGILTKNSDAGQMCGGGNIQVTEESIRKWISTSWKDNHKELVKDK